ncbi:uncharacterized protein LOC125249697 [Megalobrama amblycephala]|uniref:uncharacterized protein LOC125249697 n=1 Tax=Megalobrama amblycephala TaxID=75352 RepID=UPI0020145318|nr:uncharacterized protein LOC125249697 [Megalobrama amblycephala]
MAHYTGEQALQMVLDSEEEFTLSSEEEHDSDDERLYFEERLDPAEDTVSDENVDPSLSHSPAIPTRRARSNTGGNEKENVDPSLSHSPAIPTRRARSNTGGNEKDGDTVQRRVKSQGTWRTKTFPCPAPVTAYNQHMGGVDLSDQLIQYYTTQHKTMKWYRKIFLHFLDIAATNAFIIHKDLYDTMTHKEFIEQLIAELCGVSSQKAAPKQTKSDHVPVPGAELTSDARNNATAGRRNCMLCKVQLGKRQDTPWKCQACDIYLCLQLKRNCFQKWHTDV